LNDFIEAHQNSSPNHKLIFEKFLAFFSKSSNQTKRTAGEQIGGIEEMETASKIVKLEKSVSLLDLFKAKDENVEPRMFYAQQTGMDKVQLYPKMGGESDQIDGLRKDGTDSMENKGIIDSQNKQLMRKNLNLQATKEKHRTGGTGGFENRMNSLDPRLERSRDGRNIREHSGMANIGRDPRLNLADPRLRDANQDLKIRDERERQHQRNLIDPRFDPRRQSRK
jgi:hypothetical protein